MTIVFTLREKGSGSPNELELIVDCHSSTPETSERVIAAFNDMYGLAKRHGAYTDKGLLEGKALEEYLEKESRFEEPKVFSVSYDIPGRNADALEGLEQQVDMVCGEFLIDEEYAIRTETSGVPAVEQGLPASVFYEGDGAAILAVRIDAHQTAALTRLTRSLQHIQGLYVEDYGDGRSILYANLGPMPSELIDSVLPSEPPLRVSRQASRKDMLSVFLDGGS